MQSESGLVYIMNWDVHANFFIINSVNYKLMYSSGTCSSLEDVWGKEEGGVAFNAVKSIKILAF